MRWRIVVAAAAVVAAPEVRAQDAVLRPGSLVRFVRAENPDRIVGRLATAEGDTLTVLVHHDAFPWRVPTTSLRRLEVSHRMLPRSQSVGRGAANGFLIGTAATALALTFAVLRSEDDVAGEPPRGTDKAWKFIRLSLYGGAAGGVAGGVFGALHPGRVWQRVPLPVAPAAPAVR